MTRIHPLLLGLALLVAGCTKKNELFCCVAADDCQRLQLPPGDLRPCDDGLVCVQNYCLPASCEDSACPATAPVCDKATDTCGGCSESAACQLFPGQPVCNMESGSCVECTVSAHCGGAEPICDGSSCRRCARDSECPSLACADDGTCVPEANVVYLAPSGVDAAPCGRAQPCLKLGLALAQANATRNHIVFAPGTYQEGALFISPTATTATTLSIHGGGAKLVGGTSDGFLTFYIPSTVRDLDIDNPLVGDGSAIGIGANCTLERVRIHANTGMFVGAQLTLRDVTIQNASEAIRNNGGSITLDRGTISGGGVGINSQSGSLDLTNLLVQGTSGIGIDLNNTIATIKFSTIANAGRGGATTPSIRRAGASLLTIQSSIVWAPTAPERPAIEGGATFTTSIVGPVPVAGAMNNYPAFVDPLGDYHLTASSVARDLVDNGPAKDFEGDPRPRGARFDIGADETP